MLLVQTTSPAIRMLDNGLSIEDGKFRYAWAKMVTPNGSIFYRAAAFQELYVITDNPNQRQIEGMLGKQWGITRGAYQAGVNLVFMALGMFKPQHLGLVQLYGASENGATMEDAGSKALDKCNAVKAAISTYAQSKLRTPSLDVMQWYAEMMSNPHVLAIWGHPDPRLKREGGNQNDGMAEGVDDLSIEQNEILYRGLAAQGRNFVFQVVSDTLPLNGLSKTMMMVAQMASQQASHIKGSKNVSIGTGLVTSASLGQGYSGMQSAGQSQMESQADGASQGWGQSHTDSHSETNSTSTSVGQTISDGVSSSHSLGTSTSASDSTAHSNSQSESSGWMSSDSSGSSSSSMTSDSTGGSWSNSHSASYNQSDTFGVGASMIGSVHGGQTEGMSESFSASWGGSSGHTEGSSSSTMQGHSEGVSGSSTTGVTDTTGHSEGTGTSESFASGSSHTVSNSVSQTSGHAETNGTADGTSSNWGQSHTDGRGSGVSTGVAGGSSMNTGMAFGLVPSISIGQSWQTEDDLAAQTAFALRQLEKHFATASVEGGFIANACLIADEEETLTEAATIIPAAFHGANEPIPVQSLRISKEDQHPMADHLRAFLPYNQLVGNPNNPFDGNAYTRYGTVLTPRQVAAYIAPALYQEGTLKVIAPIPKGMGFYPDMQGEVFIGHQYSPETSLLTNAPVRLDKKRLMHTIFAGNTGYGKSVAAQRMVYEMSLRWNMRVVVLDFGFAWRSLLNAPGIEDRVDIRQLRPDGVRPLRWNPLQVGTHINPETQLKGFVDVFGSVAQLGQKQQQHRMLDAVRAVYLAAGVLVDDPAVRSNPDYGFVRSDEETIVGAAYGTPLGNLRPDQRQKLAVSRSSGVGLETLYKQIEKEKADLKTNDQVGHNLLDGIMWRLKGLVRSSAAAQFAPSSPGNPTAPVEDLGRSINGKPGVVILEGGKFLDNFTKAWLLGWAGWMIYSDMVARRERQISSGDADLVMIFEEANIIFSGLDGGDPEAKSGPSVSEQYSNMFRDSRKYGCFFGVITQSPSLIPAGIRASCNNQVIGYLTDPKDKDVVLSAIARSEKGFVDEPWRRFISDEQIGMVIGRFPYVQSRELQMPFLFRPLMLDVPEPTDNEIEQKLGRICL